MKFIDEKHIEKLLSIAHPAHSDIDKILEKSRNLCRLSLQETAQLLNISDPELIKKMQDAAFEVKNKIYGRRIVLFAPLYISNICSNNCLYCGFRSANKALHRKALNPSEIQKETELLLSEGHMRILMVAGESSGGYNDMTDYFIDGIKSIYRAEWKGKHIKRVNVNLPAMDIKDLKRIKEAGVGTYQLFQETYHEETYKKMHVFGRKSDMGYRLEAFDRAIEAGLDDYGMGALYGLYDWRFETLALMQHIEYLENKFGIGPHTVSVPRLQEAPGAPVANDIPYPLTHEDMKKLVAIIRLSVPYTGIILSTRETPVHRDELINLGVSQISAGSSVTPGGYSTSEKAEQFEVNDERTLAQIVHSLLEHNFIPSFCAACYRKERTGENFMQLAKPGEIKHMCAVNAVSTLKEYIEDSDDQKLKIESRAKLEEIISEIDGADGEILQGMLCEIECGHRDVYR